MRSISDDHPVWISVNRRPIDGPGLPLQEYPFVEAVAIISRITGQEHDVEKARKEFAEEATYRGTFLGDNWFVICDSVSRATKTH